MQSKVDSLMEAMTNIVIGLIISTFANLFWFSLILGTPMSLKVNAETSAFFTVISLVRSYWLRRAFNGRSVWAAIKSSISGVPA